MGIDSGRVKIALKKCYLNTFQVKKYLDNHEHPRLILSVNQSKIFLTSSFLIKCFLIAFGDMLFPDFSIACESPNYIHFSYINVRWKQKTADLLIIGCCFSFTLNFTVIGFRFVNQKRKACPTKLSCLCFSLSTTGFCCTSLGFYLKAAFYSRMLKNC